MKKPILVFVVSLLACNKQVSTRLNDSNISEQVRAVNLTEVCYDSVSSSYNVVVRFKATMPEDSQVVSYSAFSGSDIILVSDTVLDGNDTFYINLSTIKNGINFGDSGLIIAEAIRNVGRNNQVEYASQVGINGGCLSTQNMQHQN